MTEIMGEEEEIKEENGGVTVKGHAITGTTSVGLSALLAMAITHFNVPDAGRPDPQQLKVIVQTIDAKMDKLLDAAELAAKIKELEDTVGDLNNFLKQQGMP